MMDIISLLIFLKFQILMEIITLSMCWTMAVPWLMFTSGHALLEMLRQISC